LIDWHSPELDIIDATTRDLQLCSQHRFGQQTNLRDQEQDVGLPQQHTSCTTTQEGHSQGHNFCLVPQSAASNASLSQQEVWSAPITSDVQRVVQATDDVPFAMPPHLYQQDTFGASRATYAAALTSSTGPSPATGSRRGAIAAPHLGNGKLKLVRRATGSLQAHLAPGGSTTYKRARCDVTSAPAQPASLEPIVDSQLAANPNFNLSNSNSAGTIEDWNTARRLPGDRSTTPPSLKLDTQLLQLPTTPSQASSAVSSPASASSARSARRSPIEMRSSPASFRCEHEGCGFGFDTMQDLRHHERHHKEHGNRPYVCPECDKDFLHPKDLRRHAKVHNKDPSLRYYCPHLFCKMHKQGFNREDHLERHIGSQHARADSVMQQASSTSSQTFSGDFH